MAFFQKKILKIGFILLLWGGYAHADTLSSSIIKTDQTELRLFSPITSVENKPAISLGLEMKLKQGWKTYWRSPGDAGFPLMVEVLGSKNLKSLNLQWPVPHRFELFGLQTFGYADHVVLPLEIELEEAGKAMSVDLRARYLICERICVPYEADLSLNVPAGPANLTDDAPLLNQFKAQIPGEGSGFAIQSVYWDGTKFLTVKAKDQQSLWQTPDLLIEGPQGYFFSKPETTVRGSETELRVEVNHNDLAPDPSNAPLTLTVIDGKRGIERKIESLGSLPFPPAERQINWTILLVALLGGLILNAMPCVLPVLALKLTSIVEMAGKEHRITRQSFIATAAGIIASFLAIAVFLVGLRTAGHTIGWGVQFQQPVFLAALMGICLLFAANLIGWFSIPLPGFLANVGLGNKGRAFAKPFFTGCLATIMATPCSAPFVGTAIGFALGGSNIHILSIFMAMGLGLSLPYLLVAAWPSSIQIIPRPGRWMLGLKKILSLSLLGTAMWLAFVLAGQLGWVQREPIQQKGKIAWVAFDPSQITSHIEKGEVVFVDVTADWCLTCLANEKLILEQSEVREKLNNAITMRADWTNPSEIIANFLNSHNRYGIPFNIVYGPHAKEGIILPEILTSGAILKALESAK